MSTTIRTLPVKNISFSLLTARTTALLKKAGQSGASDPLTYASLAAVTLYSVALLVNLWLMY